LNSLSPLQNLFVSQFDQNVINFAYQDSLTTAI